MRIEGSVILITGGSSGLGLETTKYLHSLGANVSILDMREEEGNALVKQLGERSIFFKVDVTSEDQVKNAIDGTVKKWGAIHAVLNSAGIAAAQTTINKSGTFASDLFKKVIEINVYGTLYVSKHAALQMSKQEERDGERGVIVNVSSVAAFDG